MRRRVCVDQGSLDERDRPAKSLRRCVATKIVDECSCSWTSSISGPVVASIFEENLLADCCFETAVALTLRNTIVEACYSLRLLHFFDKSLIVGTEVLAVLRGSFNHEELLDVDDHN